MLEHGAARDLRDNEGKTPLEYLRVEGNYGLYPEKGNEVRSLLLER